MKISVRERALSTNQLEMKDLIEREINIKKNTYCDTGSGLESVTGLMINIDSSKTWGKFLRLSKLLSFIGDYDLCKR